MLYTDALKLIFSRELEAALPYCEQIQSLSLQADCLSTAVREIAATDDRERAQKICAQIPPAAGAWAEECYFMLADGIRASGDDAQALCRSAGRFELDCLRHTLEYSMSSPDLPRAVGQEDLLRQAMRAAAIPYQGLITFDLDEQIETAMVVTIGNRIRPPISTALCGEASEAECLGAVFYSMQRAARRMNWNRLCEAPASVAHLQAVGVPPWAPSSQDSMISMIDQFCADPSLRRFAPRRPARGRPPRPGK